jgi:hypothetical protein
MFSLIPICVFQYYVSLTRSFQSTGTPGMTTLDTLPGSCWPVKSDSSLDSNLCAILLSDPHRGVNLSLVVMGAEPIIVTQQALRTGDIQENVSVKNSQVQAKFCPLNYTDF